MHGLKKDMVLRILREELGYKCVSTKWVPHDLTQANKDNRVECCHNLIMKYESRNATKNIIVTDEKWFYSKPLGNAKTRKRWVGPNGDAPATPRRAISDKKHLVIIAVNFGGLSHFKVLENNEAVNSEVYTNFLVEAMIAMTLTNKPTTSCYFLGKCHFATR